MKNSLNISVLRGPQFYKFSDCFLDTVERRLFKNNERIEITPKAYEVLQLLVENAGELISKDDLLGRIWGDNFVEEGNLTVQISKLRSSLDASKEDPYIVNEPGSGYRFVSQVHVVDDEEWAHLIENELAQRVDGRQKFSSIAIMPLQNESADDDIEYLADGITENLINSLSNANDLRVIARNTVFQFKDTDLDLKKLGRKLRVETILTGRIRLVRDNLVIGVELTKVADGTQIWGTQINEDFNDIFEVQHRISNAIASLSKARLRDDDKKSPDHKFVGSAESYKNYLIGNHFLTKRRLRDVKRAGDSFRKSTDLDPIFARAYVGIAYSAFLEYSLDSMNHEVTSRIMHANLKIARELDPECVESRLYSGVFRLYLEFNVKEAIEIFTEVIEKHPNHVDGHRYFAVAMAITGDDSKALRSIKRISELEPFSLLNTYSIGRLFYLLGSFELALTRFSEVIRIEENHFGALLLGGAALVELGRHTESLEFLDRAIKIQRTSEAISMKGYVYAKMKNVERAETQLESLKTDDVSSTVPFYCAHILSELGRTNEAFESLEKSFSNRNSDLMALKVDPRFSRIRSDLRFEKMLRLLNLDSK